MSDPDVKTAAQKHDILAEKSTWLFTLKRKITVSLFALMSVSMAVTVAIIAVFVWRSLIDDDRAKTQELANTMQAGLRNLMIMRAPALIDNSIDAAVKGGGSLRSVMILDSRGRIAYSTHPADEGKVIDRFSEPSCVGCHKLQGSSPTHSDLVVSIGGAKVHRVVLPLLNEPVCNACHDPSRPIIGKLIIDRSLEPTYSLLRGIIYVMAGIGALCLGGVFLLLSRGVDRYIDEVVSKSTELNVLYSMVDRLSKTIDIDGLKRVVAEILSDTVGSAEICIVERKNETSFRVTEWKRETGRLERKRIDREDRLNFVAGEWLAGRLTYARPRATAPRYTCRWSG